MNMGKTNKCNLRGDEALAEVVKNTNVCIIKVSPNTEQYIHANSKSSVSVL